MDSPQHPTPQPKALSGFDLYWRDYGHFGSSPEDVARLAWNSALREHAEDALEENRMARLKAEAERDQLREALKMSLVISPPCNCQACEARMRAALSTKENPPSTVESTEPQL
jgi:hypothetical protein